MEAELVRNEKRNRGLGDKSYSERTRRRLAIQLVKLSIKTNRIGIVPKNNQTEHSGSTPAHTRLCFTVVDELKSTDQASAI